jgi:hypothetical protein
VDTYKGGVTARELTTGKDLDVVRDPKSDTGFSIALPIQPEPMKVRIAVTRPDALPEDDAVTAYLDPPRLATVALCYPADDGKPNELLQDTLSTLLPGREIVTQPVPADGPVKADLLVCDRALPAEYNARFMLCFGVLPADDGATDGSAPAEPNMQQRVEPPSGLGFEVPDLTLLEAREAVPLAVGHSLTPLAKLMDGRTLIGLKRGSPELLYIGFIPHKSTLLLRDDWSGVLLMSRWLNMVQGGKRERLPLFAQSAPVDFQLDRPGTLQVQLAGDNQWLPSYGPRNYSVTTGADGRGKLGPFVIPGEYVVSRDGREVGRLTAFTGQRFDLGVAPGSKVDLAKLFAPHAEPDWRDQLPGALLWVALALMVLEWLLWLVGVTE